MTASELKSRARARLGENNGWFTVVTGCFLAGIISWAVNATVRSYFKVAELVELLRSAQAGEIAPPELLQALPRYLAGLSAALTIDFCLSAAFAFGMASLTVAAMRGGAKVGHVFAGFGKILSLAWMCGVMQTYVFLWSLLLIVPGVRAAFSYALMNYVRADHPDWGANQCLAESKRLMAGNRWRLFCLHLSFLGWFLLVPITLGLAMFWVMPYFRMTVAAFYEDLLDRDSAKVDEWLEKSSVSPS